jgi:hypothetical protein
MFDFGVGRDFAFNEIPHNETAVKAVNQNSPY